LVFANNHHIGTQPLCRRAHALAPVNRAGNDHVGFSGDRGLKDLAQQRLHGVDGNPE
jgi:hypothetical protein